jgi:outer membrane lipoprotein-sorting protein
MPPLEDEMMRFAAGHTLLAVAGLIGTVLPTQAQTGSAALKKVADAYAGLNSYEATSIVDNRITSQGKPVQGTSNTVYLKFKQPNKINLQISSGNGTMTIVSNGTDLYIFDARSNAYIKTPAPADGKTLLREMALRAGVSAYLDPLFFLTKIPVPAAVGSLAVKGNETYSGSPVTVVTGVEKIKGNKTRNWKWWIDRENNLIRKVEGVTPPQNVKLVGMQGKKRVEKMVPLGQMTRNIVTEMKPNSSFGDDVFRWTPPPTAVQKKSVQELIKGSK